MKTTIHLGLSFDIPGIISTPVRCWQLLNEQGQAIADVTLEGKAVTRCHATSEDYAIELVSRVTESLGYVESSRILGKAMAILNR